MKKVLLAIALTVTAMSASAVQCIVNMKNGTSYVRNQTNCVTTQYANSQPLAKSIAAVGVMWVIAESISLLAKGPKSPAFKMSFAGTDMDIDQVDGDLLYKDLTPAEFKGMVDIINGKYKD